jgi:hypothetical protein
VGIWTITGHLFSTLVIKLAIILALHIRLLLSRVWALGIARHHAHSFMWERGERDSLPRGEHSGNPLKKHVFRPHCDLLESSFQMRVLSAME